MIDTKHPPAAIANAGILSYLTFNWIQPMILNGRKNNIIPEQLQRLSENDRIQCLSDLMLQEWTREVESKKRSTPAGQKPRRPNLYKVLLRCFGLYACVPCISGLLESACKISEAVLLGYVIRFFNKPEQTMAQGMGYAMGLFLVTCVHLTVHHHNFFHVLRIGTWISQSLISLMYRKCLTLSTSSSISTGAVVNLISNDLQPFQNLAPFGLYFVIGPLETIVVMYFLWQELGPASLAGLLALVLMMPVQAFFSRRFAAIRTHTVNSRDERIRTLSDIFSGIELVKLCAWEVPFQEKVMMLRSVELGHIWKANVLRAVNLSVYIFFQPIIALFAFLAYWLQDNALTPDKVFVSLTLFNILRVTVTSYLPKAIESAAEVRVSAKRITDFMLLPELRSIENEFEESKKTVGDEQDPVLLNGQGLQDSKQEYHAEAQESRTLLEMKNASFSWTVAMDEENEILELSAKEQEAATSMDAIPMTSTTNSPKKAILTNLSVSIGSKDLVAIVGPVGCGKSSFCMALLQEMPLVSGSFELTKLSGRSVTMSYSAQSPWIFAGSIRSNILFGSKFDQDRYNKVIRACELTRDLTLLPQGDATLIGEKGVTLSGGQRARVSLARAVYRDSDLYILDDPLSAVDPKVGRALFENCVKGLLKDKARVLVTHQLQYIKDCETVIVLEQGQVTHMGPVDDVMAEQVEVTQHVQDGDSVKSIHMRAQFVDVLREFAKKAPEATEEDVATIAEQESVTAAAADGDVAGADKEDHKQLEDDGASIMEKNLTTEEIAEGETSFKAYIDFFRIGSSWPKLIFTLCTLAGGQAIIVAGQFFLTSWSSQDAVEQERTYYPLSFGLYCLGTVVLTIVWSVMFFTVVTASSRSLFRAMLDALMRTSIDFFHANPHGRVLNRFSKDMANCDELLPYVFYDTIQVALVLIGSVVTVCIVNPWIIIAIPFILLSFGALRSLYMASSRQVKRIESLERSPIYSHLSETLAGLISVRAFRKREEFMEEHLKTQEDHGRAFFTYLAMARWLGYRLDVVSAVFLGITSVACVAARDSQQAARAGLAMSSVISLSGDLQWAIRMKAKVTFEDMSLTYPRGDVPVLKNISLDFLPGEKIGIVGRTGAGKSSLIGALFRLVETTTGTPSHHGGITSDGIDILHIGMSDLREKMANIPQRPFLFRGTLRINLDPVGQHQDADIWAALEASELKRMACGLDGGLDAVVDDEDRNFSIGERLLVR
ncbi:hypothetical protein BG005_008389 [Podila minutissima]|nr:hypothetical protein BG005_008389 [Podila minutissima]